MAEFKVYVGNLPYTVTADQLKELFAKSGTVVSATVISDKFSGRSKGFGFVEFGTEEEMQKAVSDFDGYDMEGRQLKVNQARPMEERKPRFDDQRN